MAGKKLTCLSCGQMNRVPQDRLSDAAKCGTCGARLLTSEAISVDPAILAKAARNDDLPLVADFWAPWCGPCQAMAPELQKLSESMGETAKVLKVNLDSNQPLAQAYGIRSVPTLMIFKAGKMHTC